MSSPTSAYSKRVSPANCGFFYLKKCEPPCGGSLCLLRHFARRLFEGFTHADCELVPFEVMEIDPHLLECVLDLDGDVVLRGAWQVARSASGCVSNRVAEVF